MNPRDHNIHQDRINPPARMKENQVMYESMIYYH